MTKRKIILAILGIGITISLLIGFSYGYWQSIHTQTSLNVIGTECLKIEMIEESEGITLNETIPLTDEEGLKIKPYTFTLKNACNSVVEYSINLESMEIEERLNSEYIAVSFDEKAINVLANYKETKPLYKEKDYTGVESRVLETGYLDSKETSSHTLRIWLNEEADEESMNKNFISKIIISGTENTVLTVAPNITTVNSNPNGAILDLEETNGYTYDNQTTINCAGDRSHCYIKVEGNVEFTGSILKKCSTLNPYEECEEIEEFIGFEPNVWYQTSNIITVKSKETEISPKIEYLSCVGDKCTEEKQVTLPKIDKTTPSVEIERISSSTNSASIKINVSDLESGVKSVEVKYGESANQLINTAILEENEYVFHNLTNNKTYFYEIVGI